MSASIAAFLILLLVLLALFQRCGAACSCPQETGGLSLKVVIIVISIATIIVLVGFIQYQKKWKINFILKVTSLQVFSYRDIRSATRNFGIEQKLGHGTYGEVYKGTFKIHGNNEPLAVKCVTDNPSAVKQLTDELMMLARLEHRNVVKVKGFCNNDGWFPFGKSGRRLYVCNEFFSEGSLDRHIFGSTDYPRRPLSWPSRFKIICGICDGLQYLHAYCNIIIAHLDLKPTNILLDREMMPKIADFGITRTFVTTQTLKETYTTLGTNGYMAPEVTERNENKKFRVGRKCDIYSLGVIIMAIVMGRGPDYTSDPNAVLFIRKVRKKFSPPIDHVQLKRDASWLDFDCLEQVKKCIFLAFHCVSKDPNRRLEAKELCSRLSDLAAGALAHFEFELPDEEDFE